MPNLRALVPLIGDFAGAGASAATATCFIAARYDDQPVVEEFLAAARAGFKAREAKPWVFLRQAQTDAENLGTGLAGWESEAEDLIRRADAVLCVAGPGFSESEGVKWELRIAQALGKPIVILVTDDDLAVSSTIAQRAVLVRDLRPAEAGSRVDSLVLEAALSVRNAEAETDHLLEQYRLILETAERLEDRRQSLHAFFLSINSLLLAAIGLIGKAAVDGEALYLLVIPFLAVLGWLLASTWARQIQSYGQVRRSKFAIVNALETQLPAAPFVAEWIALLQHDYESFTDSEQRVPHAFATLYVVAAIAAVPIAIFG